MCINVYIPYWEIKQFKEAIKKLNIIAVRRTNIDCFIPEGVVYRLHLKTSFKKKVHEPEKIIQKLFDARFKVNFPVTVREQIIHIYNEYENYSRKFKYFEEKGRVTWNLATSYWAWIPDNIKLKFRQNYMWRSDWRGCFLALTVFPGFYPTIDDYVKEDSPNSMWEKYYTVIFDPGIPEYTQFQKFLQEKPEWLYEDYLEKSFNEYIVSKYHFVCWRCSDTGKHAYFIINSPKYGMFVSSFPAPHYVPLVKSERNIFDLDLDEKFANYIAKQPQNLQGCINIVNYILQRDEQYTITHQDILSAWESYPSKYKQIKEIMSKLKS